MRTWEVNPLLQGKSVCDTLDVFVPPAIVKSRESLFYVNFTAKLKQQSFVSWRS